MALSPDGKHLYVSSLQNGTLSVIEIATNTTVATILNLDDPFGVAVTPDGKRLYVGNTLGNMSVIDTGTNTVVATVNLSGAQAVAAAPDGKHVYATLGNTVSVIATATNTVVATVTVGDSPLGLAVSPDGTALYAACFGSKNVFQIDTKTNTVITNVEVGVQPLGVVVSPDGKLVYVASNGGGQVDASNVAVLQTVPSFRLDSLIPGSALASDPTLLVVLTPQGRLVVVGGLGNVSIVDIATNQIVGNPVSVLASLQGPLAAAATGDGQRFFVSDTKGVVAVVRTAPTLKIIASLLIGP
jgi:YVTN family beta-propeller protein